MVHGVVAQVEQVPLHRVADEAGVGAGAAAGALRLYGHSGQVGGELAAQVQRLQVGHQVAAGAARRTYVRGKQLFFCSGCSCF